VPEEMTSLVDWISFSNTASAENSTLALLDKMVGLDPARRHCVNYQQARTPQSYDRPDRVKSRGSRYGKNSTCIFCQMTRGIRWPTVRGVSACIPTKLKEQRARLEHQTPFYRSLNRLRRK